MKLSKAQQEVMDHAKKAIDYAREHNFFDWYRKGNPYFKDDNDEWIKKVLDKYTAKGYIGSWDYEMKHYEMNRNGIDYLCHASSKTIKKLETLGLIEIIKDSNGQDYGFDTIRVLNY